MDTREIGMSVVALGGGRLAPGQEVDHSVGFDRILPVGTLVNQGDVIARVHSRTKDGADIASKQYSDAIAISEKEPKETPVIYQTIS